MAYSLDRLGLGSFLCFFGETMHQVLEMKEIKDFKKTLREDFLAKNSNISTPFLSGIANFDDALGGGIARGFLVEWGLPPGKKGRELLVCFLSKQSPIALWILGQEDIKVYPPSFKALGVDLESTYFVKNNNPIRDLKPVFLESLFELIIIDSVSFLSNDEMAFLAKQARRLGQSIFVVRPFLLSSQRGNPFARVRLNCWCHHLERKWYVEILRGAKPGRLTFSLQNRDI